MTFKITFLSLIVSILYAQNAAATELAEVPAVIQSFKSYGKILSERVDLLRSQEKNEEKAFGEIYYLQSLKNFVEKSTLVHITNFITIRDGEIIIRAIGKDANGLIVARPLVHFSFNSDSIHGKHAILIPFNLLTEKHRKQLYSFHPEDTTFMGDFEVPLGSRVLSIESMTLPSGYKFEKKDGVNDTNSNTLSIQHAVRETFTAPTLLSDSLCTKKIFPLSPVAQIIYQEKLPPIFFSLYPSPFKGLYVGHPDDNTLCGMMVKFNIKCITVNEKFVFVCPKIIAKLTSFLFKNIKERPLEEGLILDDFLGQFLELPQKIHVPILKDCKTLTDVIHFYDNFEDLNEKMSEEFLSCKEHVNNVNKWISAIKGIPLHFSDFTALGEYQYFMNYLHFYYLKEMTEQRLKLRDLLKVEENEKDCTIVDHMNGKGHLPMTKPELDELLKTAVEGVEDQFTKKGKLKGKFSNIDRIFLRKIGFPEELLPS